jgi:hypothetical protein
MTEQSLTTSVIVPLGGVVKNEILQAAIQAVRDDLPPAASVRAVLVDSHKKTVDGEEVREYRVDVFYTPRGKRDEPVDIDEHLEALQTPVFNPRDVTDEYA